MNMKDTMLPELMKKDGIDGLAHPIDDMLGEGTALSMPSDDTIGDFEEPMLPAVIDGELADDVDIDMVADTGTGCATEVERDRTLVMAGVGGEGIMPDGQEI